jgi:hypothetical protein
MVASPASALSSVDTIFTTVVLPAPFEPSRAKMLPPRDLEIHAAQHPSSEYDFVRPWMRIAGS